MHIILAVELSQFAEPLPQRGAVFFRSLIGVQHVMFLLFPSYLQRMQRQAVKLLIPG